MKRFVSIVVVGGLMFGLGTPAFAQDAPTRSSPISAQIANQAVPGALSGSRPSGQALVWTGAGVFVAGMGTAIYGFLNNSNGEFPEFGEAAATNTRVGAAGLTAAFAGGALMFLGHRISRTAPDIQVGVGRFSVSKQISW
jgi:hypothetical protein